MNSWIRKSFLFALAIYLFVAWERPLPKLFLIGDSISLQYGLYLVEYLQDAVLFERKQDDGRSEKNLDVPTGANGGDSRMVLAYLRAKIKEHDFKPDYLLLNCGLHDIKREPATGKIQVGEEEYRGNLEEIIRLLRTKNIQLIWIRTTPVIDSIHNSNQGSFHRFAADVEDYNTIADVLCEKYQIPVIDLFSFSQQLGVDQFIDHVHYKEPARALQAAYIAGSIKLYLQTRPHLSGGMIETGKALDESKDKIDYQNDYQ
jgi:lysophospholipase L1-like esterase